MSAVATMAKKDEQPFCTYTSLKVDDALIYLIKQVAASKETSVQEYVSDLLNRETAKELGRSPIKRRPPTRGAK